MFIVGADGPRDVGIDEYWQFPIGLWSDSAALDILIVSEAYVDWRISRSP
jgi:hypothetical protein